MNAPAQKKVQRLDSITLDQTYFTEEGYLIDHPIVTSVGIFEYRNPDGSIRRELRLPEDVFATESLASYEGKPIIITHDAGYVDKDNVEQEIVGTILSKGYQDGNDVRCKIIIHDTNAIKNIGLDTAKQVLNAPREMLIEKADLEEETVDNVLNILKAEFEG